MSFEPIEKADVLGTPYTVEYCDAPCDVDMYGRTALWGQVDHWTRSIRVYNKDLPPETVWEIIWHEVFHAVAEQLKLKWLESEAGHDELDLLALAVRDILFSNNLLRPELTGAKK